MSAQDANAQDASAQDAAQDVAQDVAPGASRRVDPSLAPARTARGCALQALGLIMALVALGVALQAWSDWRQQRDAQARQDQLTQELGPSLHKMAKPSSATTDPAASQAEQAEPLDLDRTVRVIHELDAALRQGGDLKEHVLKLGRQDYRGVAPEILQARAELMTILMRLYASQTELEDQQAAWQAGSELILTVLTALKVDSGVGGLPGALATGQFALDQAKLEQALAQTQQRHQERRRLVASLRQHERDLLTALLKYGHVYARYLQQWDRVCALRDRAYLAAHNQDWALAAEASAQAIAMAPRETEAHLLRARALIELARQQPESIGLLDQARALLAHVQEAHPERSAPALLLDGLALAAQGQPAQARLALQQAAATYPRQAQQLQDMLDPYRTREFLRQSREGNLILERYKSTMLGAGDFSPDLQLARLHLLDGDHEAAHHKILDHFSRRRAQAQWDFILSDLEFCERALGPHWRRVFPQEHYLDLLVEPTRLGSKLKVQVRNRSSRTLRNATLVLALRFTDMHRDDYQTFHAPRTLPVLLPQDTTSFAEVVVKTTLLGQEKTTADLIQHRAVLISDEAVSWVDTDEFKLAEHLAMRPLGEAQPTAAADAAGKAAPGDDVALQALGYSRERFEQLIAQESALVIEYELGKDSVHIQLPAPLALLRPLFVLKRGDKTYSPQLHVLDHERIRLSFKGVENFEASDLPKLPLELHLRGLFGTSYTLRWPWGQARPELLRSP